MATPPERGDCLGCPHLPETRHVLRYSHSRVLSNDRRSLRGLLGLSTAFPILSPGSQLFRNCVNLRRRWGLMTASRLFYITTCKAHRAIVPVNVLSCAWATSDVRHNAGVCRLRNLKLDCSLWFVGAPTTDRRRGVVQVLSVPSLRILRETPGPG